MTVGSMPHRYFRSLPWGGDTRSGYGTERPIRWRLCITPSTLSTSKKGAPRSCGTSVVAFALFDTPFLYLGVYLLKHKTGVVAEAVESG